MMKLLYFSILTIFSINFVNCSEVAHIELKFDREDEPRLEAKRGRERSDSTPEEERVVEISGKVVALIYQFQSYLSGQVNHDALKARVNAILMRKHQKPIEIKKLDKMVEAYKNIIRREHDAYASNEENEPVFIKGFYKDLESKDSNLFLQNLSRLIAIKVMEDRKNINHECCIVM